MEESILTSTKKVLQIGADDESFDLDIITHINSAFSTLHDLGVGPDDGFVITDTEETWTNFLPAPMDPEKFKRYKAELSQVKTVVYLRIRLIFDPPTTPHALTAVQKQLEEAEWRLSTRREATDWVDPNPPVIPVDSEVEAL